MRNNSIFPYDEIIGKNYHAYASMPTEEILTTAKESLHKREWEKGIALCSEAISRDTECAEAYLMQKLAMERVENLDAYAEKQKANIENIRPQKIAAVKPNIEKIQELTDKYAHGGLMTRQEIQNSFQFDGYIESCAEPLRKLLISQTELWNGDPLLSPAFLFAKGDLKADLLAKKEEVLNEIQHRLQVEKARDREKIAALESEYAALSKDVETTLNARYQQAAAERYSRLCAQEDTAKTSMDYGNIAFQFECLNGYSDSQNRMERCREKARTLRTEEEALAKKRVKRNTAIVFSVCILAVLFLTATMLYHSVYLPSGHYKDGEAYLAEGNLTDAAFAFDLAGGYKDAKERAKVIREECIPKIYYDKAESLMAEGKYTEAAEEFQKAGNYKDSSERAKTIVEITIPKSHYDKAEAYLAKGEYENAVAEFNLAGGYSDSAERILKVHYDCGEAYMAEGKYVDAIEAFFLAGEYKDTAGRLKEAYFKLGDSYTDLGYYDLALQAFDYAAQDERTANAIAEIHYLKAEALVENKDFQGALVEFTHAGQYKNAEEKIREMHYIMAEAHEKEGHLTDAVYEYEQADPYQNARDKVLSLRRDIAPRSAIAGGKDYTVVLLTDGTCRTTEWMQGSPRDVSGWKDIIAVSAHAGHIAGLMKNGSVIATGENAYGQCNVQDWNHMISVSAGYFHTVGLTDEGKVVAVGQNWFDECKVGEWKDIIAVSAGYGYTVGLRADGTVVATGTNGYGQCDVSDWTDIVAVSAGYKHTLGLKKDGTVVSAGDHAYRQCDVSEWKNITAISAGEKHSVGLTDKGTVVAVGDCQEGSCDVNSPKWNHVVAVSAGNKHTVALHEDGTSIAAGNNIWGQCDVKRWNGIGTPRILPSDS